MNLLELGKILPRAQPPHLILHKGDTVYLQMKRCPHRLFEVKVTRLGHDPSIQKAELISSYHVTVTLPEGLLYDLVVGDVIFTAEWINHYLGETVLEVKQDAARSRLGRLASIINKE